VQARRTSVVINAKTEARSKGETFTYQGFAATEAKLAMEFRHQDAVIVEMTGSYPHSGDFLASLRAKQRAFLVKVLADRALCLERIRTRSHVNQISNAPEQIEYVYIKSRKLDWQWDLVLKMGRDADLQSSLEKISELLSAE
jgi:hypothetical protein